MLDIKLFRETPDVVRKDREKRGIDVGVVDEIIALDQEWRNALAKAEEFKHKKNSLSQEVQQQRARLIMAATSRSAPQTPIRTVQ